MSLTRQPARTPSTNLLRARNAATMAAGAFSGEPASNGGCGSYSIPSWIVCATESPAIRLASASAMSTPAAVEHGRHRRVGEHPGVYLHGDVGEARVEQQGAVSRWPPAGWGCPRRGRARWSGSVPDTLSQSQTCPSPGRSARRDRWGRARGRLRSAHVPGRRTCGTPSPGTGLPHPQRAAFVGSAQAELHTGPAAPCHGDYLSLTSTALAPRSAISREGSGPHHSPRQQPRAQCEVEQFLGAGRDVMTSATKTFSGDTIALSGHLGMAWGGTACAR